MQSSLTRAPVGDTNIAEYRLLELEQTRLSEEAARVHLAAAESDLALRKLKAAWAADRASLFHATMEEAKALQDELLEAVATSEREVSTKRVHLDRMRDLHAESARKCAAMVQGVAPTASEPTVVEVDDVEVETAAAVDLASARDFPLESAAVCGPVSLRHAELFGRRGVQPLPPLPARATIEAISSCALLPSRVVFGAGNQFLEYVSRSGAWTLASKPEDASIVWMRDRLSDFEARTWDPLRQQTNRYNTRIEQALGDKSALARTMESLYVAQPDLPRFTPRAFTFASPNDFMAFLAATQDPRLRLEFKGNPWILKRADLASGFGLQVIPDVAEWFNAEKLRLLDMVRQGKHFVLQRYIANPMLMSGRKFDTRMYVLVLRAYSPVVALMADGYVRLCVSPYRRADFDDTRVHISNVAQGRTSSEFDVLGCDFFVRPLSKDSRDPASGALLPTPSQLSQWPQIRADQERAVAQVLRAVLVAQHKTLFTDADVVRAQLYGFDFTIDEHAWPWLTEVQVCPALGIESDGQEVFMDALEMLFQKLKRRMLCGESELCGWEAACAGTRFRPLPLIQ